MKKKLGLISLFAFLVGCFSLEAGDFGGAKPATISSPTEESEPGNPTVIAAVERGSKGSRGGGGGGGGRRRK